MQWNKEYFDIDEDKEECCNLVAFGVLALGTYIAMLASRPGTVGTRTFALPAVGTMLIMSLLTGAATPGTWDHTCLTVQLFQFPFMYACHHECSMRRRRNGHRIHPYGTGEPYVKSRMPYFFETSIGILLGTLCLVSTFH